MTNNASNESELHELIESLRLEIGKIPDNDEKTRARLNRILADLEHKIENPDDADHDDTLIDELNQSIELFEVEHPKTTAVLNHIMTMMSNLGI